MRGRTHALVLLIAGVVLAPGAAPFVAAQPAEGEPALLSHGTKVLVTRVRDYYDRGYEARGSGEAVERVVFEKLDRRGLAVVQGRHAAQLNVQDDARREGVEYVFRPTIERLRMGEGRDAELTVAIELLGPEVGEPIARCEAEHEIDRREVDEETVARTISEAAVEACLEQLVEVGAAPEPSEGEAPVPEGLPALEAPRYELRTLEAAWLFVGAGTKGYPPAFWPERPDAILEPMLARSDVEVCGGEVTDCPRVLSLGVGSLRRGLEPPPPASPVHVVAVVHDAETGEVLKGALAEADKTLWMAGDVATLEAMLQQTAERAVGRRIDRFGPTPDQSFEVASFEPPVWSDPPEGGRRVGGPGAEAGPGDVRLGLVIGTDGSVEAVETGDADPELVERRATGWRFEPARRNGEPMPLYVEVLVPRRLLER
jgi:hypothetical protein